MGVRKYLMAEYQEILNKLQFLDLRDMWVCKVKNECEKAPIYMYYNFGKYLFTVR
jgi:hypothetical protein